jgi:hypothetical protein
MVTTPPLGTPANVPVSDDGVVISVYTSPTASGWHWSVAPVTPRESVWAPPRSTGPVALSSELDDPACAYCSPAP